MSASPRRVSLHRAIRLALMADARRAAPAECCGLLLGSGRRIQYAVSMSNVARSPRRYRVDDRAHLGVRRWLRQMSPPLEILGVYHSHPASAALPSPTDLAEAHYPEWLYVIVGLAGTRPRVRGFRIRGRIATEVRLRWEA